MKEKSLFIVSPKYNLAENFIHHILGGCDVHNGLRCIDKLLDQLLVLLGAIAHWETGLHGMELVPGLDLHRSQRPQ